MPLVGLGLNEYGQELQWPFIEAIRPNATENSRAKSSRASGRPDLSAEDFRTLRTFVSYHRQCHRQQGKGFTRKWVSGAYVQEPMLWAVAHQNGIIINVAHANQPQMQVITTNGSFIKFDDSRAELSPFVIWCTGGHYQALVNLADVEVTTSALQSRPFIESNVLTPNDIRKRE